VIASVGITTLIVSQRDNSRAECRNKPADHFAASPKLRVLFKKRNMTMLSERKKDSPNFINYDKVSENYDFSRRAGKKTVELLVELLTPIRNANVLDIGCGTGNFLLELNGLPRQLVGLDISAGMLAQAKTKSSKTLLILGNAVFMPFSKEAFDAAYCIQALHHISEKNRFMSEVYRILQSGGRFVIQSCSHEQLSTFWFYHYFPKGFEIDRMRIPDFRGISDMLIQAGFKDISLHACPFEALFRETPELYLNKRYRDGASTFSLLTAQEIEEGCKRIEQDIRSGRTAEVIAAFDQKAEQIGGRVSFIRSIKP